MSDYRKMLLDPRWQKKRLQIFERDGWMCQFCRNIEDTLHVHHTLYAPGDPWDTPDKYLITLCESCHKKEEEVKKSSIMYDEMAEFGVTRMHFLMLLRHLKFLMIKKGLPETPSGFNSLLFELVPNGDTKAFSEWLGNYHKDNSNGEEI